MKISVNFIGHHLLHPFQITSLYKFNLFVFYTFKLLFLLFITNIFRLLLTRVFIKIKSIVSGFKFNLRKDDLSKGLLVFGN